MKINDPSLAGSYGPQTTRLQYKQAIQGDSRIGSASSAGNESLDRVDVSDLAQQVSSYLEVESAQRASEVDQLRAEYRAGGYRADADAISRKLVDEALQSTKIGD